METARRFLKRQASYEPLGDGSTPDDDAPKRKQPPFSWKIYTVFLLIGISMLWAWNGLMAASPYFQLRFRSSKPILSSFQAAELSVSTVANLGSVFILTKLQAKDDKTYPRRIFNSLVVNIVMFALLAISTRLFLDVSAAVYLGFLMVIVFCTSLATGFMQNGAFAFVAGYQRSEYMQSIMFGQAVAGVLPPIAQMVTVLSAGEAGRENAGGQDSSTSAFSYFLTAVGVSALTLLAFFYLMLNHKPVRRTQVVTTIPAEYTEEDTDSTFTPTVDASPSNNNPSRTKRSVPLLYLARRLFYPASAVFLTFGITMVFPVFTQETATTHQDPVPPLLRDAAFIPLALLIWNFGDLVGRLIPLSSSLSLASRPKILLVLSLFRVVFIPLYLICNINPPEASPQAASLKRGTAMPDAFYLLIVQLPFGLSNGYVGSCCMMGSSSCVEEGEQEAAGSFMGLCLVAGLAVGSFCSFFVSTGSG